MKSVVLAMFAVLTCGVAEASAQWSFGSFHGYLTGHVGTAVGGDTSGGTLTGGLSVSMQEATGWGAEFDFGRSVNVDADAAELDVNTYVISMNFIAPDKKIRPFATAGGGVMQVNGCAACGPISTSEGSGTPTSRGCSSWREGSWSSGSSPAAFASIRCWSIASTPASSRPGIPTSICSCLSRGRRRTWSGSTSTAGSWPAAIAPTRRHGRAFCRRASVRAARRLARKDRRS